MRIEIGNTIDQLAPAKIERDAIVAYLYKRADEIKQEGGPLVFAAIVQDIAKEIEKGLHERSPN